MSADDKGFWIVMVILYLIFSWFLIGPHLVTIYRRMRKQNEVARRLYLKPQNGVADFVALGIAAPLAVVFWPFLLTGKLVSIWWKSRR